MKKNSVLTFSADLKNLAAVTTDTSINYSLEGDGLTIGLIENKVAIIENDGPISINNNIKWEKQVEELDGVNRYISILCDQIKDENGSDVLHLILITTDIIGSLTDGGHLHSQTAEDNPVRENIKIEMEAFNLSKGNYLIQVAGAPTFLRVSSINPTE